jgi:hypothetical protein
MPLQVDRRTNTTSQDPSSEQQDDQHSGAFSALSIEFIFLCFLNQDRNHIQNRLAGFKG